MKSTLLLIIGLFYTFLMTSNGEKSCKMNVAFEKSMEACKDKLSEENAKLLKEDEFADNEEIRCFTACVMNHAGIMTDKKIDIEKIGESIKDYMKDDELNGVIEIFKECKTKAEEGLTECDVAGLFVACFKDLNDNSDEISEE